jgi:hypothetical protein
MSAPYPIAPSSVTTLRAIPLSAVTALTPAGADKRARSAIASLASAGWLSVAEASRLSDAVFAANSHMLAAIAGALEAYRRTLRAGAESIASAEGTTNTSSSAAVTEAEKPQTVGAEDVLLGAGSGAGAGAGAGARKVVAVGLSAAVGGNGSGGGSGGSEGGVGAGGTSGVGITTSVLPLPPPPPPPPLPPSTLDSSTPTTTTSTIMSRDVLAHPDVIFACGDLVETLRITLQSAFLM